MLTGLNFIGNTTSGTGHSTFQAINPSTEKKLEGVFVEASDDEIDQAILKADRAFKLFRNISNEKRALFLEKIGEELLNLGDELVKRCMDESALPEGRIVGERGRTINQLKLFAKAIREGSWRDVRIDTALPERQPLPRADIRHIKIALGPVGIFGASNFPLAFSVAGGDTTSALAAGCPVIVKAHPLHPGTSELVGQAIVRAIVKSNMPDGVFSLLHGTSHKTGMSIVNHEKICAIGFTGSYKGGKAIFDAANKRSVPIPVFAEMGSANPVFILPEILATKGEEIADGLLSSLTLGVGQFCTNPGLIVTNKSKHQEDLLDNLKEKAGKIPRATMLSSSIKSNYDSKVKMRSSTKGVTRIVGGQSSTHGNQADVNIFTTSSATFLHHSNLDEEVFGPSTLHVSADSKEDLIAIAERLEGHLTATIFGTDSEILKYQELVDILETKVGRIIFNQYPTGVEVCDAMVHGGPFPATTASASTSVGTGAISRFARPVCYQNFPQSLLPDELKDENPLNLWRLVNGQWTKDKVTN